MIRIAVIRIAVVDSVMKYVGFEIVRRGGNEVKEKLLHADWWEDLACFI